MKLLKLKDEDGDLLVFNLDAIDIVSLSTNGDTTSYIAITSPIHKGVEIYDLAMTVSAVLTEISRLESGLGDE
jgi:hypothetical protein